MLKTIVGFDYLSDDDFLMLNDVIEAIKKEFDVIISEKQLLTLASKELFKVDLRGILSLRAIGGKEANPYYTINKSEVLKLVEIVQPTKDATRQKSEGSMPIKGKPETLRSWIKCVVVHEKGLSLNDEMHMGFQQELIRRAREYGYEDEGSVKRAWSKLELKSAKK